MSRFAKKERMIESLKEKALRLAKAECANFSILGPFNTRFYCCQEPAETNHRCLLSESNPCVWFAERVLPLNSDLAAAWQRFGLESNAENQGAGFRKCKSCRKFFKPRSNRQERCPECAEKNAKVMARIRKKRQRAKG